MKENDKSLLCHVASKRGRKATMHILHLLPLLLKIESGILCQMNNWIMITWIIDTFLFIWNIMGHFPCLLTLCSALSRLVEMAPLLLMFIWSLEMCICWTTELLAFLCHTFKSRSLSKCCLWKCILSFSLMETVLLLSSREDAAHPSALVVVVCTHF